MNDAVIMPSTLALLPEYSGIDDPITDVRRACREAVAWLARRHPRGIAVAFAGIRPEHASRGVSVAPGLRIGRAFLAEAGVTLVDIHNADGLLVLASGSAKANDKAPGYLDERARDFDMKLTAALSTGDTTSLLELDDALAEALWCLDVSALKALATHFTSAVATTTYVGNPYGVQYWIGTWTRAISDSRAASTVA